jgi:hypothetical protein
MKSIVQIALLSAAWGISFLVIRIAVVEYPLCGSQCYVVRSARA